MYNSFYPTLFDRKYFENTVKVNDEFEINNEFITQVLIDIFFFEKLQIMFIAMKLTSPFLMSISVIGGIAIKVSMFFIINQIAMICTGGSFLVFLVMNGYFLINAAVRVYDGNHTNDYHHEISSCSSGNSSDGSILSVEETKDTLEKDCDEETKDTVEKDCDEETKELSLLNKLKKFSHYNPLDMDPYFKKDDDKEMIENRNKQILEEYKTYVPNALNDPEEIVNVVEQNKKQKKSIVYDPLNIDPFEPTIEYNLTHKHKYKINIDKNDCIAEDTKKNSKCKCTKPCDCEIFNPSKKRPEIFNKIIKAAYDNVQNPTDENIKKDI